MLICYNKEMLDHKFWTIFHFTVVFSKLYPRLFSLFFFIQYISLPNLIPNYSRFWECQNSLTYLNRLMYLFCIIYRSPVCRLPIYFFEYD